MNLMLDNSALLGAVLVVGALSYIGALAFDPAYQAPRVIAGYVCGAALLLIGAAGMYYGASFELPLVLQGAYFFEASHMEWLGLGLISTVVGALLIRQAYLRQ